MTKKTIFELTDGEALRKAADAIAFQQGSGTTYKGTSLAIPEKYYAILNEAQLIAQLPLSTIPASEARTISLLRGTFPSPLLFENPIILSAASKLLLKSDASSTFTAYTGFGNAFIQSAAGIDADFIQVKNLVIASPSLLLQNSCFDLVGDFLISINELVVAGFTKVGIIEKLEFISTQLRFNDNAGGLVLKDNPFIVIDGFDGENDQIPQTFLNIITDVETDVFINKVRIKDNLAGDSFIFIDPNAPATASFSITNSQIQSGNFYQPGTDIAATAAAVGTDPINDTQFDITAHNLREGQYTVLKNFTTFPGYDKTVLVTAVNGVNSVDLQIAFLGVDSTGTMNAASLDETDVRVNAQDNPGQPNSMVIGGWLAIGTTAVTTITTSYTDLVLPGTRTALSYNQRIVYTGNVNGEIEYIGENQTSKNIPLSITLDPAGGGDASNLMKLVINRGAGYVDLPDLIETPIYFKGTNITANLARKVVLEKGDKVKWVMRDNPLESGTNVTVIVAELL